MTSPQTQDILSKIRTGQLSPHEGLAQLKAIGARLRQSPFTTAETPKQPAQTTEVAVVGMACQFPGAANLVEFWDLLREGRDAVDVIPTERWDASKYYDSNPRSQGKTYSKWGGTLANHDHFDPAFFNLSPREAEFMDPQQRLFLMVAWHALEHAGLADRDLNQRRCGVFVGTGAGDFRTKLSQTGLDANAYAFMGNSDAILSARLSYLLNLRGPTLAVDTACSSSLVAIHLARESICRGETELAIAGGVTIQTTPQFHIMTSKAGMLSPRGRCHTFADDADGFVPGEGVAVLILKPLAKAIADRDTIHAVIAGSAINQDGRTNGITAPNAVSQTALEREVYEKFEIDPEQIGYVEAHGTGTKLGDPIEVEALTKAFETYTSRKQFCAIGSVKSNIGHALSAAGVAGALKAILCLEQRTLVPSLNCQKPNQLIDFAGSPFRISTDCEPWHAPSDGARHAAVSSFGFSGTNAHLVFREAPAAPERLVSQQKLFLLVLSAKSEAALNMRIRELRDWFSLAENDVRFEDVAFTTLCGRSHLSHRRAWVVRDAQDWFAQLEQAQDPIAVVKQRPEPSHEQHFSDAHLQALGKALHTGLADQATTSSLQTLAKAYLEGHELSWSLLFADSNARRIPLPIYPFDLKPYNPPVDHSQSKTQLGGHPLVGLNVSTLEAQIFRTQLEASDFYLRDHRAAGRAVFPAAAYLEMARATAALSLAQQPSAILDLQWQHILSVDRPTDVDIEWFSLNHPEQAAFEIVSYRGEKQRIHASGRVVCTPQKTMVQLDIQAVQQRCPRQVSKQAAYAGLANHGMDYGPSFQLIEHLQASEREVIAKLLPASQDGAPWQLHPAVTDSLLQSMLGLLIDDTSMHMWLPTSVAEVVFPGATVDACWAYVQAKQKDTTRIRFDASLHDQNGHVILAMRDVCVQQLQNAQLAAEPEQPLANNQDDTELAKALTAMVSDLAAQVLKVDPSQLDPNDDLTDYGFDSISFTELGDGLSDRLGLTLAPSMFFEHRNLTSFIAFLIEEHHQLVARVFDKPDQTPTPQPAPKLQTHLPKPQRSIKKQRHSSQPQTEEPMAIIGMAGIMPKSPDLNAFWENLKAGRDLISEIPSDRWDWREIDGDPVNEINKCNVRYGGFIAGVDHFDAGFFGISPREAEAMDPQQRLFLQSVWHCFEDAGYPPSTFAGKRVGVFAGVANMDYNELWRKRTGEISAHAATGTAHSIVPNRVSYLLDFQGPSEPIDTACSSGLVAVYRAMQAIREGSCEIAVAGGVNVMLTPTLHIAFNKAGMLNPNGACRTFDANANGYVRGEGVGTLLLKPLSKAEADGDHIHAVLLGGALNHGGHATSLTAPNPNAQADLLVQAYQRTEINADQISYIETHGTGTKLGDPAEVSGLTKAFKQLHHERGNQAQPHSVALGAVKSNIGHLETAAGVAGLFKVALAMRHRTLPANIHFDQLNPYIDLNGSPFYIPTESHNWNPCDAQGNPIPRVAGVSSFGFGGAYAHLVLREYAQPTSSTDWQATELFVLSAKTAESVEEMVCQWLSFCQTAEGKLNPSDVAHSSRIGREPFNHRLCMLAGSWSELRQQLNAFLEKRKGDALWYGEIPRNVHARPMIDGEEGAAYLQELARKGRLAQLASLWLAGVDIDWQYLAHPLAKRVPLPVYAFAKHSFWPPQMQANQTVNQPSQQLHPLLTENISTLHQQCFRTRLTVAHPLLAEHHVKGQAVLPGAATVEWARAAGTLAADAAIQSMRNLVWIRPISVQTSARNYHMQLSPQDRDIRFSILTEDDSICCQGQMSTAANPARQAHNLEQERKRCTQSLQAEQIYQRFATRGLELGSTYRVIQELHYSDELAVARLSLDTHAASTAYRYHPALLDGMWQTAAILMTSYLGESQDLLMVPFALEQAQFFADPPAICYAIAKADGPKSKDTLRLNVSLIDDAGQTLVHFQRLAVRAIAASDITATPSKTSKPKPARKPEVGLVTATTDWRDLPAAQTAEEQPNTVIYDAANTLAKSKEHTHLNYFAEETAFLALDNLAHVKRLIWSRNPSDTPEVEINRALKLLRQHGNQLARKGVELRYLYRAKDSVGAAMVGFARCARMEYPGLQFYVIAVATDADATEAISLPLSTKQVHLRIAETCQAEHYVPVDLPDQPGQDLAGQSVLITGGTGALGQHFARDLAKRGCDIALCGRRAKDEAIETLLETLQASGSQAIYVTADMEDAEAVETAVHAATTQLGKLDGVIHAAGCTADAMISKKTPAEIQRVFASKIHGTQNLQAALTGTPITWLALFGSLASVTGNPGQSDYAYANAYLSQLAANQSASYRILNLDWPYWADGGMQIGERSLAFIERQTGMQPLPSDVGIDTFYRALASNISNLSLAWGKPEQLAKWLDMPVSKEASSQTQKPPVQATSGASPKLQETLEADLLDLAADVLKIKREQLDPENQMDQYGFDSINLTDFSNRLTQTFNLELLPSIFFEYPTLRAFTNHLVQEHQQHLAQHYGFAQDTSQSSQVAELPAPPTSLPTHTPYANRFIAANNPGRVKNEPIAVVGMSGRLPGGKDLERFWQNLLAGKNAVSDIPASRWDWRRWYGKPSEGKTRVKSGAFIEDVDAFDAGYFGVAPKEAKLMDPQHRLLLQAVWSAIEDAGHQPADLSGRPIGLYIGVSSFDYQDILRNVLTDPEAHELTGNAHSILVNRISYMLNLRGPSEPVDTACSSSLVAVHNAVRAIRAGDCEAAITGGVNLLLSPIVQLAFAKAGMLSQDGNCKTFDKAANGYVRGEGVGALLLKPLSAALRDGNPIHGIIRGTAINHGGRANTLVAPNPNAQAEVINAAIKDADIAPESISYIEAHGTGTALGDPIEINGLKKAFSNLQYDAQTTPIALGSVKTQIGHLEAAAGIAGLLKVLLSFKHRKLPGNIQLKEVNPYIRLQDSPFELLRESRDWQPKPGMPLTAGVSSFGFGGVNSHIIMESYQAPEPQAQEAPDKAIFPFSARTPAQLKIALQNFAEHLDTQTQPSWRAIAYTLQVGREAMKCRVAILADDWQDLRQCLQHAIAEQSQDHIYTSQQNQNQDELKALVKGEEGAAYLAALFNAQNLEKLATLWAAGIAIDWNQLYPADNKPARAQLPTYPFAEQRFWPCEGSPWQADDVSEDRQAISMVEPEQDAQATSEAQPTADAQPASVVQAVQPHTSDQADLVEQFLLTQLTNLAEFEADQIDPEASLAEMGLDSIFAMELLRQVEAEFGLRMYPNELAEYDSLAKLRDYIVQECHDLQQREAPATAKANIFLLSTPRAGSTLLRAMLMGHSQLFAPPELHLLPFENMAERRDKLAQEGKSFLAEGLLQTLTHLDKVEVDVARERITQWEHDAMPIAQVYRELNQRIGDQILIDKSPSYAESLDILRRAEALGSQSRYVHLVRHPLSMAASFTKNRFDKMLGVQGDPWQFAFELWQRYNANLEQFLATVAPERVYRLRFEDLMAQPETSMQHLSAWLGVPFETALLDPYQGERMTAGLHPNSLPIGDPNFSRHKALDPKKADVWRKHVQRLDDLSDKARDRAIDYGYEVTQNPSPVALTPTQQLCLGNQKRMPSFHIVHQFTWPEQTLDLNRLQLALKHVISKHQALRLAFKRQKDQWSQTPVDTSDAIIPVQSFESSDEASEIIAALNASLDPSRGKNLAIAIQTHEAQAPTMTLVVHHLVSDGVALALLGADLQQIYASPGTQWPQTDDRYLTFAKEVGTGSDTSNTDQVAVWREHIAEPLKLPYSRDPETDIYRHEQSVQRQVALTSLQQQDAQLHEHLAVGLYRAVAAWTKQDAPLLALRHHGRSGLAAAYHDVVGWFACDMPLKLKIEQDDAAMIAQFKQSYAGLPVAQSYTQAAVAGQLPVLGNVAPIRFNYQPAGLGGHQGATSLHQDVSAEREYALDLIARVQSEQLLIIARYGRNHSPDEVIALIDSWLSHCQIPATDGATEP